MNESTLKKRWYLNTNTDLHWDINSFQKKAMAYDFVLEFESRFCVYSSNLSEIYGQYSINSITRSHGALVVLPRVYSRERFSDIDRSFIKPTGVYIHPGWLFGLDHPHVMTIPIKHHGKHIRSKPVPLAQGFALANNRLRKSMFLPILLNGSLREYRQTAPYLHLHRLDIARFKDANIDTTQVTQTICEKLKGFISPELVSDLYPEYTRNYPKLITDTAIRA